MDSREEEELVQQSFPAREKWLPSLSIPAFLSPSGGTVKGYGAEAITPVTAFRDLIWKILAPLLGMWDTLAKPSY